MTDAHAETETPICPGCMNEVAPEIAFCPHCQAPLGSVTGIDPIQRIWAMGYLYRKAAHGPRTPFSLIAVYIFIAPAVFLGAWLLFEVPWTKEYIGQIFLAIVHTILFSIILYRATRNYIKHNNAQNEDDQE